MLLVLSKKSKKNIISIVSIVSIVSIEVKVKRNKGNMDIIVSITTQSNRGKKKTKIISINKQIFLYLQRIN